LSRALLACAAAVIVGLAAGCGDSETFTAESFVAAANEHDAGLELGEPLPYAREGAIEQRVLRFQGTGPAPTQPGSEVPTDVHGSGTLTVLADDAAALAEYERCESTALICFRAANVALFFSGQVARPDLDRLIRALQAMSA
jgi:hypothetical protein